MTSITLTTTAGCPIANNQNSKSVGPRGPLVMEDYQLFEKLAHQNRERIPERVVHAKGVGAHGTFTVTNDVTQYSKAKIFSEVGKETPMICRFSTVAGEMGAADNERDVRGFALKFYTEEGNWDMVGNNTPVFFIRDPYKFPDFIHTQKRHPRSNLRSPTAMWDYWSLSPEALHQVTILMSDRGCPKTPMHMNGYGSHTYSFINADNDRFWVKFHFKTQQGHEFLTTAEAAVKIGQTREGFQEALFEAIENYEFPAWDFKIQIMTEEQALQASFNPFDLTKVWPHSDYPLIDVGTFELNRNVDNYFSEVENCAYSPSNIVPGIDFSPDRVLQARIFSYPDAHRYRLGAHYESLPVNQPVCPVHHYHKDGKMNFRAPRTGHPDAYYEPNSHESSAKQDHRYEGPSLKISGEMKRYDHREDNDDYGQARALYNLMNEDQLVRLHQNIANSMDGVPVEIVDRALRHFDKISLEYGEGIRRALKRRQSSKTICS